MLTTNALHTLTFANPCPEPDSFQPVLQAINIKKVVSAPGQPERYRFIISDGTYFGQAMLATQLNELILDGSLKQNTVVKITSFAINFVSNRRFLLFFLFFSFATFFWGEGIIQHRFSFFGVTD